ncbi:MAG: hypothetical protein ACXVCV_25015, partial [Polyangia bacterium]
MRKTPVTLGVLAIIFGAIVALYDGGRLGLTSMAGSINKTFGAAMPQTPGQPDPKIMMERAQAVAKQLTPYTASLMAAMVVFSLVLIFIGVGLYKRKSWARSAAIGWSALGLIYLAADTIVQLTIILPRTQAMMQEIFTSMPNADKMAPMMGALGGAQTG